MSELTYVIVQSVLLIFYASWVAYRAGFGHGQIAREKEMRGIE